MDNKENRQFYWSVKDFIEKPIVLPQKEKQANIKDVAKSILEQNKEFKQTNFDPNSSTINITSQTIDAMSSREKGYTPTNKAYTKNSEVNPFNYNLTEKKIIEKYLIDNNLTIEYLYEQYLTEENSLYEQSAGAVRSARMSGVGKKFWDWLRNTVPGLKPKPKPEPKPEPTLSDDVPTPSSGALSAGTTPKSNLNQRLKAAAGTLGLAGAGLGIVAAAGGFGGDEEETPETTAETTPEAVPATPTVPAPITKSPDDLIDDLKRSRGMPVPILRPRGGKEQGNYGEWKAATTQRNAATREANIALERERKKQRDELRSNLDAKTAIGRSVRERWVEGARDLYGAGGMGVDIKDAPSIDKLMSMMTPEEKAEWDRLSGLTSKTRRTLGDIDQATSNEGLTNTLRQQATDRDTRWQRNLDAFRQKSGGAEFDRNNPEHQNIMRGVMGFGSLTQKPVSTGAQPGEMDPITGASDWDGRYLTQGQRERLGTSAPSSGTSKRGVALSPDTPDWVRRHAEKFGEESAREIEAMRLGATSVLQGDPTRPMDYSMSADEVMRRGQLLDRDRREYAEKNPATTSGRQTGIGTGRTAMQPESTWDEVARKSVKGDSELANAPLVRRNGRVYAQTPNGEIELSTGSMNTSQYAPNAPTRDELNRRSGRNQ
jgi:hypothetical protein